MARRWGSHRRHRWRCVVRAAVLLGAVKMNTCKTCKYWGKVDPDHGEVNDLRVCEMIESAYFTCEGMKTVSDRVNWIYHIGEDCVLTGPDFGCIHHEAKPVSEESGKAV